MVGMSTVCMRAHAPKDLEEQANFTTAVVSTTTEAVSSTGAVKESSLQVGHFGHWPPHGARGTRCTHRRPPWRQRARLRHPRRRRQTWRHSPRRRCSSPLPCAATHGQWSAQRHGHKRARHGFDPGRTPADDCCQTRLGRFHNRRARLSNFFWSPRRFAHFLCDSEDEKRYSVTR